MSLAQRTDSMRCMHEPLKVCGQPCLVTVIDELTSDVQRMVLASGQIEEH